MVNMIRVGQANFDTAIKSGFRGLTAALALPILLMALTQWPLADNLRATAGFFSATSRIIYRIADEIEVMTADRSDRAKEKRGRPAEAGSQPDRQNRAGNAAGVLADATTASPVSP
ncbi:MAG TPA: hypothetical protein PK264_20980 [Hyphomicrobiaceae bacterium]|nr:hypothetical protein [Hyphomicrobiaceae bacterium]